MQRVGGHCNAPPEANGTPKGKIALKSSTG
jgi:hypothetical protein